MIQKYLKTGMVFYDDREKQHFRHDCCKEVFYHYIDNEHFPSFQFFTDVPINSENIQIEIYNINDELIGIFDNADFNAINTIYHGTTGYTYVHNIVDIISYPAGIDYETGYYLKICFSTEIVAEFIHSTDTKGDETYTFGYQRFTPIYYYNKKTYHVCMQRDTTGYDSRAMIWAYDHEANTESANYDLHSVSEVTGDTDMHPMPSVIVADDGHIVVAQEFIRIGDGNHNDAITIKRSDNAEDETSWINAKAENAGFWTYIGSWQPDNSQRLAYPIMHKDASGNLYVICRRYTAGGRYNTIHKSIDHGVTWDAGHDIIDSENNATWMYNNEIKNGTDNTLRYSIGRASGGGVISDRAYYLESDDGGVTWHDISNSFSKDTVASGAITMTELENAAYDFLIVTPADVGEDRVSPKQGTIDEDGNPFIIIAEWDDPMTHMDYRMFYWDGNSWANSIIKNALTYNTNPVLIHRGGTMFDCYLEDTANQMSLYKTWNLTTWVRIKYIKETAGLTANTFLINNFTNNYKDTNYWMFVGVWGTDALYSDVFVAIINPDSPDYCWYSEAFKVCDCEVNGVGDGLDLITNGWFEDWSGAANPNNVPDGWTVHNNDATNYVADADGECQLISDNTQSLYIRQTPLTIGQWYVWRIEVTAVIAGGIQLYENGNLLAQPNTLGEYNIVFQASATDIRIYRWGICNITFTNVRLEEFVGFEFCDRMTLNWWSDCDWDDIIYQYGYKNSLVLADPDKIELQTPSEDIKQNAPPERQGEIFFKDVIIKKRYMFKIRIPEYLWNALIRLAAYGSEMPNFHCWITLPDGSSCKMSEVNVLGEWDKGNCMNTFTVEFVDNDEYPVVAGNCCKDEDVSEV